jgi:hypothetical protein
VVFHFTDTIRELMKGTFSGSQQGLFLYFPRLPIF